MARPGAVAWLFAFACGTTVEPPKIAFEADVPLSNVAPEPPEALPEPPLPPFWPSRVWWIGQRWRTFTQPPCWAGYWDHCAYDYEVVSIDGAGRTTIQVTPVKLNDADPERPFRLVFDASGRPIEIPNADTPNFLTGSSGIPWPSFPLVETADGDPIRNGPYTQRVRREGGVLTVVIEGPPSSRTKESERVAFHWEFGRPWFYTWQRGYSNSPDPFEAPRGPWVDTIAWDFEPGESAIAAQASKGGVLHRPVWKKGHVWVTRLDLQNPAPMEPALKDLFVEYEVLDVEADGTTEIGARIIEATPTHTVRQKIVWTIDPSGAIIDAAYESGRFKILNRYREGPGVIPRQDVWPGAAFAWPRFPIVPTAPDEKQLVRRDGGIFRIRLEVPEHRDLVEGQQYQANVQWVDDRPWYETLRIDVIDPSDPAAPHPILMERIVDWDAERRDNLVDADH